MYFFNWQYLLRRGNNSDQSPQHSAQCVLHISTRTASAEHNQRSERENSRRWWPTFLHARGLCVIGCSFWNIHLTRRKNMGLNSPKTLFDETDVSDRNDLPLWRWGLMSDTLETLDIIGLKQRTHYNYHQNETVAPLKREPIFSFMNQRKTFCPSQISRTMYSVVPTTLLTTPYSFLLSIL